MLLTARFRNKPSPCPTRKKNAIEIISTAKIYYFLNFPNELQAKSAIYSMFYNRSILFTTWNIAQISLFLLLNEG